MDNSQQGDNSTWSSTKDKKPALSRSNSPHPPQYQDPVSTGLTVDPALASANPYSASDSVTTGTDESLNFTTPYLSSTSQNPELLLPTSVPQPESFNQGQGYSNSFQESFIAQLKAQGDEFTSLLNSDFSMYPTDNNQNANFNDPSIMFGTKFDAAPQQDQQQSYSGNPSINPADLSRISSPHNPTSPPHLVPPDPVPSPRAASPVSSPGAYYTPQHSRHASLDPVTAAYMTSQQQQSSDWQGLLGNPSFQGHRRAPSEHSDVSSVHSPFLGQHDSFDGLDNSHSPLLTPRNDPSVYENSFGMESFSISDHQAFSPAHSPYNVSPRLGPQPPHHGELPVDNSFHLTQQLNTQLGQGPSEQYVPHIDTSPHPTVHSQHSPGDIGQAAQMTPPSINVEFAPPSRTSSFGPPQDGDNDTLSPPSRKNSF